MNKFEKLQQEIYRNQFLFEYNICRASSLRNELEAVEQRISQSLKNEKQLNELLQKHKKECCCEKKHKKLILVEIDND
jgi:hypothetical protein